MEAMQRVRRIVPGPVVAALEVGLWIFAGIMLAIAGWMKADAATFQWRARDQFVQQATATAPPATATPISRTLTPILVPEGSPIARLAIPRLELDVVVAEGTSDTVLRRAVGHLPGSAHPGQPGNVVLAGHRDTFFRPLADVREGDEILVENPSGRHAYRVEWTSVVKPDRVDMIAPLDEAALTLVTCYPFNYVGSAPLRFVVRARQIESTEL